MMRRRRTPDPLRASSASSAEGAESARRRGASVVRRRAIVDSRVGALHAQWRAFRLRADFGRVSPGAPRRRVPPGAPKRRVQRRTLWRPRVLRAMSDLSCPVHGGVLSHSSMCAPRGVHSHFGRGAHGLRSRARMSFHHAFTRTSGTRGQACPLLGLAR